MKKSIHSALWLSAMLAITSGTALAATSGTGDAIGGIVASAVSPHRVTRAHVLAELQAAQELGLVPITYVNYPYSEEQAIRLQQRTAEIEAAQARGGSTAQ